MSYNCHNSSVKMS